MNIYGREDGISRLRRVGGNLSLGTAVTERGSEIRPWTVGVKE